ncbi:MAG: hypothetical protein ABIO70_04585 [Pseudomonadota bacterium]
MGQGENLNPASQTSGEHVDGDLAPMARGFFREIAEARREKRRVMAALDPASPLFQALTGSGRPARSSVSGVVRHLPGEEENPLEGPLPPGPRWDLWERPRPEYLRRSPSRLGLNMLHAYELGWNSSDHPDHAEQVNKYGANGAPIADAALLGASVVRQHGQRDLFWGMLARAHLTPADLGQLSEESKVPLEGDLQSTMEYGIDPDGNVAPNSDLLGGLMDDAEGSGVKLIFSFLTIGGGGDELSSATPPESDFDTTAVEYENLERGSVIDRIASKPFDDLGWVDEHEGQVSPRGGLVFPVHDEYSDDAWFFEKLDPACPYKREYIGLIAAEAAALLNAAADHRDMRTLVEAIEIFNEVDTRDLWILEDGTTPSPASCGEKWGRAYLHAAWAFRRAIPDTDVALKMPGIASYTSDSGMSWEDKKSFVGGFVDGVVAEALEHSPSLEGASGSDHVLGLLPDLLQGVDLHWYHKSLGEGGLRHIGYLVFEIAELSAAVSTAVADNTHLEDPVQAAFPEWFPVTVFENGWGLIDDTGATGITGGAAKEEFQAWEVWRRLGGALAGGAAIAGWHTWMSVHTGSGYIKMGLRNDEGASTVDASLAEARPSWGAYYALAQVLGGKVLSGSMLLPAVSTAVSSRLDLENMIAKSPDSVAPVVFEFRLGVMGDWAYMVLIDPSLADPGITLVATPGEEVLCQVREITYSDPGQSGGNADTLPPASCTLTQTIARCPFSIDPTWQPRLFVCSRRLTWAVVSRGATSLPARLHERPAWMDDAGEKLPVRGRRENG